MISWTLSLTVRLILAFQAGQAVDNGKYGLATVAALAVVIHIGMHIEDALDALDERDATR